MVIIGAASFWSLSKMNDEYRHMLEDQIAKTVLLEKYHLRSIRAQMMYGAFYCLRKFHI